MTYSLFEFVKERFDELIQEQPEDVVDENTTKEIDVCETQLNEVHLKKAPKKEQLTKAQKRRQWDKVDSRGVKPRGWDWVDVIHHLLQTGPKEETAPKS